jgi:hypothetical protein
MTARKPTPAASMALEAGMNEAEMLAGARLREVR